MNESTNYIFGLFDKMMPHVAILFGIIACIIMMVRIGRKSNDSIDTMNGIFVISILREIEQAIKQAELSMDSYDIKHAKEQIMKLERDIPHLFMEKKAEEKALEAVGKHRRRLANIE